jgi:hypothetical protein
MLASRPGSFAANEGTPVLIEYKAVRSQSHKEVILAIYCDLEQWCPKCGACTLAGARHILWACWKKENNVGLRADVMYIY